MKIFITNKKQLNLTLTRLNQNLYLLKALLSL